MEGGGNGAIVDPKNGGSGTLLVLQLKPIATYKSNDEYLVAMKEDLADWFTCLYKITINVDNFFEVLETGVMLCEHANKVRNFANEQKKMGLFTEMHSNFVRDLKIPQYEVQYRINVKPQTFQARDNISNFITWTKKLGIPDVLCFETDDLVLRKNEKSVVLCLLEIARVGAKLGMLAPTLVKMEEEIDAEIAGEPPKQIKTCDVKSLHEMVKELAGRCTCPVQFPIIKVGEGKYKIGDSQTLVFVRILRNHVMIRVGGGWDTLEHYLDKHDPCRCGFAGHKNQPSQRPVRRSSTGGHTHSQSTPNTPRSPRKMSVGPNVSLCSGNTSLTQRPASPARMRSMSPSPASSPRKLPSQPASVNKSSTSQISSITGQQKFSAQTQNTRRSQSPVPSKFRSPSPSPAISRTAQVTTTSRSQVVPVKRCSSPSQPKRCVSPSPAKRCTSPAPSRGCASPGPSRKPSSLSVARSKPTTPLTERRHLPRRPSESMDSSGNIGESTESPDMNSSVSMDAISTMTLDQFKNLLSNALSVPNGHNSEGSLDSPRSQSSTDSLRQTYTVNSGKKRSSLSDTTNKYKTWTSRRDISKSFDSDSTNKQEKTLKSSNSQDSEYYELDKPAKRAPAVSTISRPKTHVSSVQRPKTPVSSTSVSRPKTPTAYSNIRPTTPVNTASRPKTPTSNVTSKIDTGLSTFKRPTAAPLSFTRPKTPTRLQNKNETAEPTMTSIYRTDNSESHHQPLSIYESDDVDSQQVSSCEKENNSRLSNIATKTYDSDTSGYYSSLKSVSDSRQSNVFNRSGSEPPQQYGSYRRSSDTYISSMDTHCDDQESTVISKPESESRPSSLPFASKNNSSSKTDLTSTSGTKPPSPNIGYVTLKSEDTADGEAGGKNGDTSYFSRTYQNLRRLSMEGQTEAKQSVSNSVSDSSLSEKSDSIRSGSVERNHGTSRQGSFYSVASSSSSLKDETSFNNKETNQSSVRSDSFSREPEERDIEKKEESVPRPSTPVRPCTPSLIPRPSTPSLIPRPSTPLSNLKDSIDKLERQPAYSSNSSVKNTAGRPPTPRKATILAKSPSANATDKSAKECGNDSSYTNIFLSRRSKTPGPASRSSNVTVATPRRSRTPGPGERSDSYESFRRSDDLKTSLDNGENRTVQRSKPVPSSPAVQRRPRTPSTELKPLTRQSSSEGTTVITVNRSSGKHTLNVESRNETKPAPSVRPSGARIIARSPTAQLQRNTQQENDRSRGRARTKSATPQDRPPRPRSVDPESYNHRDSQEQVPVVERDKNGTHFLTNRMEAWVESAVKNTASKTVVKATKRLPPRPQRSKTPNPRDFHDYELQSRPLEEIKAALSLPVNGLKEVDTDTLDAPPEDPEMYAKMDELFQKLKEKELKASVNETPGNGPGDCCSNGLDCNDIVNSDELSLDSNENVKRRRSSKGSSSYRQSPSSSNKGSVPNTPTRSKASSFSREGSQVSRASSTPPRPPTPTRSGSASRRSSSNSYTSSNSVPVADYNVQRSPEDHATLLVSKIKEMITTKPRPADKPGFKSRIPAPKSLSNAGKSKSFSNLSSANISESKPNRQLSNGSLNKENYYYDDDCGHELSRYSSNGDVVDYTGYSDTIRSGNKTPVPKLTMPLTTGRKEFLNNQRDANNRTPKLVRALSISSLSSSSNTLSCTVGDDEDFV